MAIPTIYRVISKDGNKVLQFRDPEHVGIYLLGRRQSGYILIKSDQISDRVITLPDDVNTCNRITEVLSAG